MQTGFVVFARIRFFKADFSLFIFSFLCYHDFNHHYVVQKYKLYEYGINFFCCYSSFVFKRVFCNANANSDYDLIAQYTTLNGAAAHTYLLFLDYTKLIRCSLQSVDARTASTPHIVK